MDEERKVAKSQYEEMTEALHKYMDTAMPLFEDFVEKFDAAVRIIADVIHGALGKIEIPQYLITEWSNPRKKPRGTKRRKRQGRL